MTAELPYTSYRGLIVEATRHHISDGLSPEAVAEPGKQRQLGPGDITSCVFERSVVCVIWFRWKHSVWIAVGYGFPVLSLHRFQLPGTHLCLLRQALVHNGPLGSSFSCIITTVAWYSTPACLTSRSCYYSANLLIWKPSLKDLERFVSPILHYDSINYNTSQTLPIVFV